MGTAYANPGATRDVGPILEWGSPDDVAAWLREHILSGETFQLKQLEQAKRWAQDVSRLPEWGLTKQDALVIIDYVNVGRKPDVRRKLDEQFTLLMRVLDRSAVTVETLQANVERWTRTAVSKRGVDQNTVHVVARYVHLTRRWPR